MSPTSDHAKIIRLLNTFGVSIDMRDWQTYEGIFADKVDFDYSAIDGPTGQLTPKEILAGAQADLEVFRATQHAITNHVIRVEGDEANCSAHVRAMHFQPNPQGEALLEMGGHYTVKLVRAGDDWKIKAWKFAPLWSRGNTQLFDIAKQVKVSFDS